MSKLFSGGVPTDIDVRALRQKHPEIQPGETVSYKTIAETIRAEVGSSRFRSVTAAWRKQLYRTENIVLEAVAGTGFRRVTEPERSVKNVKRWTDNQRSAIKRVNDQSLVVQEDLSERERKTHSHASRVMQAHMDYTISTAREIAPPKAKISLPRFTPPSEN